MFLLVWLLSLLTTASTIVVAEKAGLNMILDLNMMGLGMQDKRDLRNMDQRPLVRQWKLLCQQILVGPQLLLPLVMCDFLLILVLCLTLELILIRLLLVQWSVQLRKSWKI